MQVDHFLTRLRQICLEEPKENRTITVKERAKEPTDITELLSQLTL